MKLYSQYNPPPPAHFEIIQIERGALAQRARTPNIKVLGSTPGFKT